MYVNFKGQQLTVTKCKNNIIRVFDQTSDEDRTDWYWAAREFAEELSDRYGVSVMTVAGIIAALSPMKRWSENKRLTENFFEGVHVGHMNTFLNKAICIYLERRTSTTDDILEILNGNKIRSFFTNIMFPLEADTVTIDRHALSVALGRKTTQLDYSNMTNDQYEFFVQCYKEAAKKLGESPVLVQSATWVWYRKQSKK